jgi:hypothetical protein
MGSLAPVRAQLTAVGTARATGTRSCGSRRWPVKTLSDALASRVDYRPLDRKVTYLRSLRPPGDVFTWGPYKSRTKGVERHTYRIAVRLVEATRESDSDIHLVVASPDAISKTMIVELPDTTCNGAAKSAHRDEMKSARARFLADCGAIGSRASASGTTCTVRRASLRTAWSSIR